MLTPPDNVTSFTASLLLGNDDSTICPETVIGKSGVGLPATLANALSSQTPTDKAET
jgi:hypothetical protein